ncbi:MAG: galactose mutarotase [Alistipes sp.]|nr:galactose mutarotase [Alistipes sp.]
MMEILQHIWGTTPEGEAIVLYTIRNANGCEVQLCNIGASIVSVKSPDREGNIDDIVLGYKDAMSYFGDGAASGKSVGRVANRIAKGKMTVDGVEYSLEINNGPNHLHGGSKGFANQLWEGRVETNRVVFSRTSPDGEQNYPGELYVEAGYYFSDDNELEITYVAKSDKNTVVNLTNHVYWNLAGEGSGKTILDHELLLNCSRVLEMDPTQIPTGEYIDVKGTPQDFTSWRKFGDEILSEFNHMKDFKGYDHFFVLDGWQPNILSKVGELRHEASGRKVEVLSSQAGAMVYTGNWLEGGCPVTKSGGRYQDYSGVAIECQNYPNAVNEPRFPSIELKAGDTYCQKIVFKLGTF